MFLFLLTFVFFICSMSAQSLLCLLWSVLKKDEASSTKQLLSGGQLYFSRVFCYYFSVRSSLRWCRTGQTGDCMSARNDRTRDQVLKKGVATAGTLTRSSVVLLLQVIKVYNEDNSSRAVEVPSDITARDVCQLFVLKNQCVDDHNWTLFEHLPHLGIGKTFVPLCIQFCFSLFTLNLSTLYLNYSSLVLV